MLLLKIGLLGTVLSYNKLRLVDLVGKILNLNKKHGI